MCNTTKWIFYIENDSFLHFMILSGNSRSVKAKKNIIVSALIKGADTLVYLLLVPLTLGYLNPYEYGIWLTLNSLLMWVNSFDIGLGSGLRNMLTTALAEGNDEKGKCYVSTTLIMLICLSSLIFGVGYVIIENVDWYSILNVEKQSVYGLSEIILASFFFFCVNFVLRFIGNVFQALQLPAINYFISFSGHLLSLVFIYILTLTIDGSLMWVAVAYSAAPPLVYLICYPLTFFKLYPYLSPSLKYFKKEYIKDLLSLSILFFIIQVMGIVLFSLSNVIISNIFGPDQVTPYNITYRYFSILPMAFNLMLAPLWSAATDAYVKGELQWIKNSLKKLNKVLLLAVIAIALMILFSGVVYHLWIGDDVIIPLAMTIYMGIYMMILIWSLSYSTILNGIGVLRLQTINIVIVAALFYPICSYLCESYGPTGMVIGMCIINLPGAILNTIQLTKILNRNATGIWMK